MTMKIAFFQDILQQKIFFVVKIAKNTFRRQKCTQNQRRCIAAAVQFTVFEYPDNFFSHSARSNACSGAERDGSAPTSAAALCDARAISSGSVQPSAKPEIRFPALPDLPVSAEKIARSAKTEILLRNIEAV